MRKPDRSVLQLEDLRCFVGAVEHKSLTAAAAAEGVAQSAFSRQLARLEASVGGRLLHRTGRGVEVTELGARVLPRAQALLAQAQSLADEAAGRWSRPSGTVNVGLLPSLTHPLAGRLFARVHQEFPEVQLRLHEAYSGEIETLLADGRIDLGTFNRYRPLRREAQDAVLTSAMCLVAAPATVSGRRGPVHFAFLAEQLLVLPHRPNSLRSVIEEIARKRGLNLQVVLEVDSSTGMKDVVTSCGLCTALPAHAVAEELRRGELVALPITHPGIRQTTFLDTTRRRPASAAVREVERVLKQLVRNLATSHRTEHQNI